MSEDTNKMERKDQEAKFQFEILEVDDNLDGTANVRLNVSDEFIEWFKKDQGLKRWSQKRFEKYFIESFQRGLKMLDSAED